MAVLEEGRGRRGEKPGMNPNRSPSWSGTFPHHVRAAKSKAPWPSKIIHHRISTRDGILWGRSHEEQLHAGGGDRGVEEGSLPDQERHAVRYPLQLRVRDHGGLSGSRPLEGNGCTDCFIKCVEQIMTLHPLKLPPEQARRLCRQ